MQSQQIAEQIGVPRAEMAKVLQLLVWGGFVSSRRGTKGGFQLTASAERLRTSEVIDFFLSKYESEPDRDCPVMRALRVTTAPGQDAFGSLTLADIASGRFGSRRNSSARKAGVK